MPNIFEPMDAIRFGWNTLKKNLSFFIVLMIVVAVLSNITNLVGALLPTGDTSSPETFSFVIIAVILSIIGWIINIVLELGLLGIALDFRDGKSPEINDVFRKYPLFLKYLLASIIYSLMVFVGLIFLIVPGIYLALKYQLFGYLIVDKGLGPIGALKESGRMTDGAKTNILVFWLTLICGTLVIMIFLGLFVAIPIYFAASAISESLMYIMAAVFALVFVIVDLLVIEPIIKLSTADIYRILQMRSDAMALSSTSSEPETVPEAETMPETMLETEPGSVPDMTGIEDPEKGKNENN